MSFGKVCKKKITNKKEHKVHIEKIHNPIYLASNVTFATSLDASITFSIVLSIASDYHFVSVV